jgi:hypothetical protein
MTSHYATICGSLAQGAGLVTLMSQAPVTPGPRTEATRQSDNRNHCVQLGIRCVPRTTPSAVEIPPAINLLCTLCEEYKKPKVRKAGT